MPVFTVRKIEDHKKESGKNGGATIEKASERGLQFKNECYLKQFKLWKSKGSP